MAYIFCQKKQMQLSTLLSNNIFFQQMQIR